MGARTKAIFIPIGERDHLIGDAELMGFSGRKSQDSVNKFFYDQGYKAFAICGKVRIHMKKDVYQWMKDHDEQQSFRKEAIR